MSEEQENVLISLPPRVYQMIESSAVDLYLELNIRRVPVQPLEIAEQLGILINRFSDLPRVVQIQLRAEEQEGLSFYSPDTGTFVIYYDDSFSDARIRFTIMHEIGHIRLGHREESDLARRMADTFSAYALAPSPLMGHFSCDDYMDVVNLFGVSKECAEICFGRYQNWAMYGGPLKPYEKKLLDLFS